MNIKTARKIAQDVGNIGYTNDDRRRAFWRLDRSVLDPKTPRDVQKADRELARNVWNYFGNRAVKGKDTR